MVREHHAAILFLLQVEHDAFPRIAKNPDGVEHVRKLLAAKYGKATIPAPSAERATFGQQPPATILRLTLHGSVEVERLKKLAARR